MAQGKVTVNSENQGQGATTEVERVLLFVGTATKNTGSILSVNTESDLGELIGVNPSELKTQITAAILNADNLFRCYAAPIAAGDDPLDAIDVAMQLNYKVEGIVLCRNVATQQDIADLYAKQKEIASTYQRPVFILVSASGIDAATETWATYQANLQPLTDGIAAETVGVVPLLHGNDLGAVAGRLCKYAPSIADSPMRVKTGPMVGLGATPLDSDGVPLPSAVTSALDALRFSCVQYYTDYAGVYFGDLNLLDAEGGDYQVIQNLRIVNYAKRRVRPIAISMIGNRQLNRRPVSEAWAKRKLMAPLFDMASSTKLGSEVIPGLIEQPEDDAIAFQWQSNTFVRIYMRVTPYQAATTIVVSIGLDLSNPNV